MLLDSKSRISKVLSSVFGSRNSRLLKQTQKKISAINALEENLLEKRKRMSFGRASRVAKR